MQKFYASSLFILMAILFGCCTINPSNEDKKQEVLRLNLDEKPNMIAFEVGPDTYAAYDGKIGSLYKVWKGSIKLTGPVFDNIHGPQPRSQGKAYIEEDGDHYWFALKEDKVIPLESRFFSYRLNKDQITLNYELTLPSGEKVSVSETPSFSEPNGNPKYTRNFATSNVPEGVTVLLRASFEHLLSEDDVKSNSEWIDLQLTSETYDWGTSSRGSTTLKLKPNTTTYLESIFQPKATASVEIADEEKTEEPASEEPADEETPVETNDPELLARKGMKIIGNSDCAACHQMDNQLIGPSYTMIAKKYPSNTETIDQLSQKIIQGGSGVWGQQVMSAHPNVSEEDAKAMAAYILSTVPDEENEWKPGVAVDFYKIGQPLPSLPEVVAGQNPNESIVYPSVDFRSGNPDIGEDTDENFSGFVKDFVMEVNGFLNVPESKTYQLQFVANNGGKLTINGEVVSEGHFYEGTYKDEFEVKLEKGANPFRIDFYHHLFDKYLILGWKTDENDDYTPIPPEVFTHNPFDVKSTSPGVKSIVSNKAPGFGASLEAVHPAFTLSEVRPQGFEPRVGDLEFRANGNLVLCTWGGEVYEMENVTESASGPTQAVKIADGLCEPLGITEVDGEIYVLQRWELTKLVDHDGDGQIDEFINIATFGSNAQFHEWSFGLLYRDGYFYCTTGIAMGRGSDNMSVDRGKVIKIAMDGTYEHIAYGLKEPNGIGFGPDGEIFVADNEGEWQPVCKIFHIPEEGKPFYGNKSVEADNLPEGIEIDPPVIYLPQNEIGNSPSQPIIMHGGPYEGQLIHGEITHGGIKRDYIEKIKGQYQGAVFRFTQGLEVGINRLEWGPDGALYVSGLGGSQDFGWKGTQFGLQRLTYNGNLPFEMLAIRAKQNGLEVEFTKPLRIGDGTQPSDYKIQQWHYYWTGEGISQQKRDLENLPVKSVSLSDDRTKAFLEISGMKEGHVLYVQLQPAFLSEDNNQLWTNEGWYTLNKFPDESGFVDPYPYARIPNQLNPLEEEAGWNLLFQGKNTDGWKTNSDQGWKISKGHLVNGNGNSLIATTSEYDNFELEFEWKLAPDSEGGVLFHVPESDDPEEILASSPRFQLIDDRTEESKTIHTHKSGAVFDIKQPDHVVTNSTNEYNKGRLVVNGNQVEHWVNGVLVTTYEMDSADWQKRVESSMYTSSANYGKGRNGRIALYAEKGTIYVRNIRIRPIMPPGT